MRVGDHLKVMEDLERLVAKIVRTFIRFKLWCFCTNLCLKIVNFQYDLLYSICSFIFRTGFRLVRLTYAVLSIPSNLALAVSIIWTNVHYVKSAVHPNLVYVQPISISFWLRIWKNVESIRKGSPLEALHWIQCDEKADKYPEARPGEQQIHVEPEVWSDSSFHHDVDSTTTKTSEAYPVECAKEVLQLNRSKRCRFVDNLLLIFQTVEFYLSEFCEMFKTRKHWFQIISRRCTEDLLNAGLAEKFIEVRKLNVAGVNWICYVPSRWTKSQLWAESRMSYSKHCMVWNCWSSYDTVASLLGEAESVLKGQGA